MRNALLIALSLVVHQSFLFSKENDVKGPPLFQFSGGFVNSSIDLSRYNSSITYRGLHGRLVTHVGSVFFISAEYSAFPVHESPSSWVNVHTRKMDLNGQVAFATTNSRTHILAFLGIDKHEWTGTRTKYTDLDQLGKGLPEGTVVSVDRWGLNCGVGFTHTLYDNIGVFGDCRFNFSNAHNWERIRITDVMTTFGVTFAIEHPQKSNGKKSYGIGKKIYKWTEKGAQ